MQLWVGLAMNIYSLVAVAMLANLVWAGAALGASRYKSCHDANLEAAEPAARVYSASPFVHGYRDGYQHGFHDADIDLQFAHEPTAVMKMEDYRNVRFKPEFGDRESYVPGYRAGFVRGVADMRAGRDFQLFATLQEAMLQPRSAIIFDPKHDPKRFDAGVKQGYAQRLPNENCSRNKEESAGPFCAGINFGAVMAEAETVQRTASVR